MDSPIDLALPASLGAFTVASVRGRERTSWGYRFEAVLLASPRGVAAESLLSARARLSLRRGVETVRVVHGVVSGVVELGLAERGLRAARVTITPAAFGAKLRRARRIFQDKTTIEIVSEVLLAHGAAVVARVRRERLVRAYCVQYDERDWDFVVRLLAEEGYFFFFEHPEGTGEEVLCVADEASDQGPIDGAPALRYERVAGSGALSLDDDHVTAITLARRTRPAASSVHGYDFRRPDLILRSDSGEEGSSGTASEHEGSYESDFGPRPASVRLEQLRSRGVRARGETVCRRLAPGRTFTLDGLDEPTFDGEWAVTSVEHEAFSSEAAPPGRPLYRARFEAVPATSAPRPRWRGERPRGVAETAVVIGPPGEEVFTDAWGRVKVRFHWDAPSSEGARGVGAASLGGGGASAWLRVTQAWAGAGWGAQLIPRVGMEVVVTFLGGDPDRPLVTGCVVNATHPPPFPLPEEVTRSGLRTRTLGGQGFNELSFDDAPGNEQVYLHAEADYVERVERNHTSEVRGGRLSSVAGSSAEHVAGRVELRVGGARDEEVGGDDRLRAGGHRAVEIGKDESVSVEGGSKTRVRGHRTVEARLGHTLVVGTDAAIASMDQTVFGSATTQASGHISLRADAGIRLTCGRVLVDLSPDRLRIVAPTVEIRAEETLTLGKLEGPTATIGDDIELLSKKVRVFTEGAALELDRDAKVAGARIKLGYDPARPEKSDRGEEQEQKVFRCRFADYYLEPHAKRRYHLMVGGLRFEGETDAEGRILARIPKDAREAVVRLWTGDYPDGPQEIHTLRLAKEIAPVVSVAGGKLRLRNLGYYEGDPDEQVDAAFRAAVTQFQSDHEGSHGLVANGQYDVGTQGALEEVYGS